MISRIREGGVIGEILLGGEDTDFYPQLNISRGGGCFRGGQLARLGYHPSQHSHVPGITGTTSGVKFAGVVFKPHLSPDVYVVIPGHVQLNSRDSGSKIKGGTYEECN